LAVTSEVENACLGHPNVDFGQKRTFV